MTHKFTDILFLLLCSSIAGATGWEDIEDFGDLHFDWFRSKGLFPNGIPTHDTIARVISRVEPSQFQYCFIGWMKTVVELSEGQLIAIIPELLSLLDIKGCLISIDTIGCQTAIAEQIIDDDGDSVPRKQKRAHRSTEYLEKVIVAGMNQNEKN